MMRVIVTLLLATAMALPAQAELLIRITEGADNALPVAVVPFGTEGGLQPTENISEIVRDDLAMSGEFAPLEANRMLSLPTSGEDVFYRDWRMLGQKYLLVGNLSPAAGGSKVQARFELFDVNREARILGETATVSADNLRTLGHHISDKVYKAITGNRGVFSTRIAYVTLDMESGKRTYRLNISDVDGKRSRVFLKSKEPILSPDWSPDGKKLAYVSFETGRPAIYVQELASGKRTRIAQFPGLNSAPSWSPDGKSLLMTLSRDGNAEIYRMNVATRQLTRLTNHWAIDTEPSWAPDGDEFVFTSDRSGGPQSYLMDADGGDVQRLTFGSRYNARPRFSPDGEHIFYVHKRENFFHIARLNIETGQETILTRTKLDESPSVAPNGRLLIYATQDGGKSVLAVISADGGSNYVLPSRFGDVREPAWSPFID
ncbi:Tol-Pal system beta propeller repeat protein TolB [Marinobacter sp. JSM 1782161]|uniref:Tol-Pal system beta propeller repeat protein TolB n=1 Tax=Marinobacter sp. JSM 1782161 TaxID=2685906 RepID=UPI0014036312|nr:Tol-Pal system beta propeller repeat protein TolB [Marinobacter sp. JSM 1782161]